MEIPVVGAREPCPCGSGRRYKACHGRGDHQAREVVLRPFEGLSGECDWVALREIVPAATAVLQLKSQPAGVSSTVSLATLLPLAWSAMVRVDGSVYLGLQSQTVSGDVSRDLGAALAQALELPPGSSVPGPELEPGGPRLQDLLAPTALDVVVHAGFGYWGDDMPDEDGELAASLERASESVVPTARLVSVEAGYWCRIGPKFHLRWVLPDAEERLLDALARLHAAHALMVGAGSRYVGAFRACGLVVPVWDLPSGTEAAALEEPAAALRVKLDEALAETAPLTSEQRRSRAGLLSRQVTLR
jgi:Family of unknown function (DUF5926)/SEC-C motif